MEEKKNSIYIIENSYAKEDIHKKEIENIYD